MKYPTANGWKNYLCGYEFEGQGCAFDIRARSVEEAERRLKALATAYLSGELSCSVGDIPHERDLVHPK